MNGFTRIIRSMGFLFFLELHLVYHVNTATAGEIYGKTIDVEYTVTFGGPFGHLITPLYLHDFIYIGNDRHIYSYTHEEGGDEYVLDQWKQNGYQRERYTIEGNKLIKTSMGGKLSAIVTTTVLGNSCTVSENGVARVKVSYCKVVDGHLEYRY